MVTAILPASSLQIPARATNTSLGSVSLVGGGGSGATLGTITYGTSTSGGLTKIGAGQLTFANYDSYTGTTTVAAGVLQADDGKGLPFGKFPFAQRHRAAKQRRRHLSRPLGTSGHSFQWQDTNGVGYAGGFAGGGGALAVNIGGNAATLN